ncbi:MAG: ribonuclease III [Lachnospiraceae bacterium]|jgi:ribonuclease-3|nr:ribonuclease III [Lachnospiraceae bacterium]
MKIQREFEEKIGYCFQRKRLLSQALTHSSYANERHLGKMADNERLEFLGDAVLEIVTSDFLYFKYPKYPEGELTRLRASIVCEPTLAFCTRDLELGRYLLLGKGEDMTGGRERDSILSDAMEAVIGAIYLDGGFASAKEFVHRFVLTDIEHKQLFYDSKTILQEIIQGNFEEGLKYHLLGEEGPDHDKKFIVEAWIGETPYGKGCGRTKKGAEQEAAYKTLIQLKKQGRINIPHLAVE